MATPSSCSSLRDSQGWELCHANCRDLVTAMPRGGGVPFTDEWHQIQLSDTHRHDLNLQPGSRPVNKL